MKFREKQSEWFGKRGLSWHISSVIFKDEDSREVEVQSYAHLFDCCTQDWYAVASILEDLLVKFKSSHPSISQVYLRSDEAGCYHNNSLIAALPSIGERTGISVRRFDHSETQQGKPCDRILCPMKAAIRTFFNEGHAYPTEANVGWALAKARSGSSQFSEKVKDYLTKKFDIGGKTEQKVSAEEVAKAELNFLVICLPAGIFHSLSWKS